MRQTSYFSIKNISKIWTLKVWALSTMFLLSIVQLSGQGLEISNVQKLEIPGHFLVKPKWNRTGDRLLVTGEHNKGIYSIDVLYHKLDTLSQKQKVGRNAFWTNNNEVAILKKGKTQLLVNKKSTKNELSDTLAYIDIKRKQIFQLESKTGKRTMLTKEPGLYYLPKLSPNGQFLLYHFKSGIYIQSLSEDKEPVPVGKGIASSWHPNSRYVFFFVDLSNDGHQTSSSDLYYYSIDENKIRKLTDTFEQLEMWPSISADGKMLAFSDEKTGTIYIAEITEK